MAGFQGPHGPWRGLRGRGCGLTVAAEKPTPLKAPFPYMDGKSKTAALVWARLGDVRNYIEPFCGSAANLLLRPHPGKVETINDVDCYITNFWRAVAVDPQAVADHCNWPVDECDLHARHRYLVLSDDAQAFRIAMRQDPDYFDARIAGWWCWGQCLWIGSGWCSDNSAVATPMSNGRPHMGGDGRGQQPHAHGVPRTARAG